MHFADNYVFFCLLYNEYFKTDTKLGKWRIKMIMEKAFYDEWACAYFREQILKMREMGIVALLLN